MIKRFCMNCGKEVMVEEGTRMVLCDDCRAERDKKNAIKAREASKKKKKELGLVTVSIYDSTRDKIKELAKAKNMLFADFVKELIEGVDEAETEPTEETITEPVEPVQEEYEAPKAKAKTSKSKKTA